jgi:hypothetical protein
MRYLFFRCNLGHFFNTVACPYCGWTYDGIRSCQREFASFPNMSIDDFAEQGIDEFLISRMLVVECQCEFPEWFTGVCPGTYSIGGRAVTDILAPWRRPRSE